MEDVVEMLNELFERDIFASNWTKPRKLLEETTNDHKVGWIIVSEAIRRYTDNLSKLPTSSVCEWCFTTFKASTVPCCLVSSSINLRGVLWVSGPAYYTSCRTIHHGKLILNRSQTVTTLKSKRDWFIIRYCWLVSRRPGAVWLFRTKVC